MSPVMASDVSRPTYSTVLPPAATMPPIALPMLPEPMMLTVVMSSSPRLPTRLLVVTTNMLAQFSCCVNQCGRMAS